MKKKTLLVLSGSIGILMITGASLAYLYDIFYAFPELQRPEFTIHGIPVNDFGYVLQYDNYYDQQAAAESLGHSKYDLLILDLYFSEVPWTPASIATIQSQFQEKMVLCYISIGEAESYRPYWDAEWDLNGDGAPDEGAPAWLDIENPDWGGNYKVKYWEAGWQSLLYGNASAYLDIIINTGFDGAYLDIIDAYEYYEEQGVADAAELMVNFVVNISEYCKALNPEFLIVPQNGEALGNFSVYPQHIDGIGREDVIYDGNTKNSDEEVTAAEVMLKIFLDAGLFVLEIEYPTIPRFTRIAFTHAAEASYLCYVGPRDLDFLKESKGWEPD